jgi:2-polyprenyl-6-methoxyphenol hydroxylase-like FAD-dependent oxidoreductase
VKATFVDGTSRIFDVLVGADGYRSLVHSRLSEQTRLVYAGYVAWRGTYPEERLDHRALLDLSDAEGAWFFLCYAAGHAIVYVVPGFNGRIDPGHRQVNWLVYAPPPLGMDFTTPTSVPTGTVSADLHHAFDTVINEAFPVDVQAVYRASSRAEVSIQPIYDRNVDSYVSNRVLVIGDAGAVARPHTGSGTTKALQDALCLERLGGEHNNWDDLLAAYDAERSAAGNALVDLGRRIGRDQVESTPQWPTLTPHDFDAWTRKTLDGQQHYFYGSDDGG